MPARNTCVSIASAALQRYYTHTSTDHIQQEPVILVNIYTVSAPEVLSVNFLPPLVNVLL